MTTEGSFVPVSIPKFDGYYDHWSMLMETFLRSKQLWGLIKNGVPKVAEGAQQPISFTAVVAEKGQQSDAQRKQVDDQIEEMKLKNLKVKNYLFQAIDRTIIETILDKETSKNIWESMKQKYQGTNRVKRAHLQALRKEFEVLQMREGEMVNEFFGRTLTIVNKMKVHGGTSMTQVEIIEKILRSMTSKFDYVVCSIEESNDLDTLSLDELQSSFLVHEQRMNRHNEDMSDEQALKVSYERRERPRLNKALMECFKCHKLGYFQYECPNLEKRANYVKFDDDEEILL